MKTIPSGLAAHYATRSTTVAELLKIVRPDGVVFGFTSHDVDSPAIAGVIYKANPGLDVTSIATSSNTSVGNLELTSLHDGSVFTTADILGGVWRNSEFLVGRYNWANPSDGVETLLAGTVGEVEIRQTSVVAELRDLRQYLQQAIGDVSSKTCRARLGDARCRKDLTAFTFTGSIDVVTSNRVFQDTGLTQTADFFGEGEIIWSTGNNAGQKAKIKSFSLGGTLTLALPMFSTVQVGDTFTAIAGCRKRVDEDCKLKFNNILNFVGEPHRKGINDVTKTVLSI